jgi:hypothetical protein
VDEARSPSKPWLVLHRINARYGFKSVDEAVRKALKEGIEPPFEIDYVTEDKE